MLGRKKSGRKYLSLSVKKTNQFCHNLLGLKIGNSKLLCNLVMALSSDTKSKSVVEISESPLFHYEFSSLFKCIESFPLRNEKFEVSEFTALCLDFLPIRSRYILQLDVTPYCCAHSPTLEDRQYVKIPNTVISGNKPVDVGYPISSLQVQGLENEKWSLPVALHRLSSKEDSKQVGVNQIKSVLESVCLPFHTADLIINTGDTDYSHASFLAPLYEIDRLLNVVRLRTGSKVYKYQPRTRTGGSNGYKGQKAYLLMESGMRFAGSFPYWANSIFETFEYDEYLQVQEITGAGRSLTVHLYRFNNFLMETKQGHKMCDKPVDILVCKVMDTQTGESVFKPMYNVIAGKRKQELGTIEAYQSYRHRYDIEPSFRFGKQQLKLDKYQTSKIENFDRWLMIYQLAFWLLFVASDEVSYQTKKWRSYKKENKPENLKEHLSPAQTFSSLESLLLKIEPEAFKPRSSNKGKGREEGTKLPKKKRYKVRKKNKKQTKIDNKDQQNV